MEPTMSKFTQYDKGIMMDFCTAMRQQSSDLKPNLKYSITTLFSTFRMRRLVSAFDKQLNKIYRLIDKGEATADADKLVGDAYKSLISLKSIADKSKPVERKHIVNQLHQLMQQIIIQTPLVSNDSVESIAGKEVYGRRIDHNQKQEQAKAARLAQLMRNIAPIKQVLGNKIAFFIELLSSAIQKTQVKLDEIDQKISSIKTNVEHKNAAIKSIELQIHELRETANYAVKPSGKRIRVKEDDAMGGSSSKYHSEGYKVVNEMVPDLVEKEKAKNLLVSKIDELLKMKDKIKTLSSEVNQLTPMHNELDNQKKQLSKSLKWIEQLRQFDTKEQIVALARQLPSETNPNEFYIQIATLLTQLLKHELDPTIALDLLMAVNPSPNAVINVKKYLALQPTEEETLTNILKDKQYAALSPEVNAAPLENAVAQANECVTRGIGGRA